MQEENLVAVAPNRFRLLLSRFRAAVTPMHNRQGKQEASTKYLMRGYRKASLPMERQRLVGKEKNKTKRKDGRRRFQSESKNHMSIKQDDCPVTTEKYLSMITLNPAQGRRGSKISVRPRFSRFAPIIEEAADDETPTNSFNHPDFPLGNQQGMTSVSSDDLSIYTTNTLNSKYYCQRSHNKQEHCKSIQSCNSDDMSLFTTDESLLYTRFPDSFTAVDDGDGDGEASFFSACYSF